MPVPRSTITQAGVIVIVAMAHQSFEGGHLRSVGDGVERRDTGPLGDTVDDHGARTAGKMEAVADRQAFPPSAQPSNLEFLRVYKKRSNDQYLHNFDVLPSVAMLAF